MAKAKESIKLSKRYGLNPSITHCECCGKELGIALFGADWKDENGHTAEAPRDVAIGLCDDCKKVIDQQGLMIIEVRDGESGNNPYRTGRLVGITKDAKEKMFKDINSPICYMEQSMFSSMFGHYCKAS